MAESLLCARCGEHRAPITVDPPLPPALAAEVRSRVCETCWRAWEPQEVIVINELRLNFMDPRSQEVLQQRMREFLGLDTPSLS